MLQGDEGGWGKGEEERGKGEGGGGQLLLAWAACSRHPGYEHIRPSALLPHVRLPPPPNSSTTPTPPMLLRHLPALSFIRAGDTQGCSAGPRLAIEECTSRLFLGIGIVSLSR